MTEEKNVEIKNNAISGFIWRLLQNSGTQIISFILSIILARLLMPEDYGLIAMVSVFTSIAMVFINTGFSSAIIQQKEISQEDLSSVFVSGLLVAIVLYIILFFCAPAISFFYHEDKLVSIIRVQSISLIIASLFSVQQAIVTRNLQFKKSFIMSFAGSLAQGITGIVLAMRGTGVWSLVISSLIYNIVCCMVIDIFVKFKPSFCFSIKRVKRLFSFSSKILLNSLLDTVFNNIRSLFIGRIYSSEDLAYYNRGYQFPVVIMGQVDGSMTTVLFSSLSKYQEDWSKGLSVLRRAMKTSIFICAPMLAGLCAVADPLVRVLLTDKWAESIPYVRLVSLICLFWPLSARIHALNARGYSNISLIMNVIGKILVLVCLLFSYKISMFAMVASSLIASGISLFISAFVYRKYLDYSIKQQLVDVIPSILIASFMGFLVYSISLIQMNLILLLIVQIVAGIIIYSVLSLLFNKETFQYCFDLLKGLLQKHAIKGDNK